jgi:hypothetical protein
MDRAIEERGTNYGRNTPRDTLSVSQRRPGEEMTNSRNSRHAVRPGTLKSLEENKTEDEDMFAAMSN